jgi:hypothetical protein
MEEEKTLVLSEVREANIEKAKAANPGASLSIIETVGDSGETFSGIFRRPDVLSLQKYLSEVSTDKDSGIRASASLVSTCIVFPIKEDFFSIQKEYPLISIGLANELFKGFGSIRNSKKKSI